ncbi:MAG: AAA family ATPase, partial [Planctomycetota bacterium]
SHVYHFSDTSETARVMQSGNIEDNQQLKGDFSNLAAFLYALEVSKPEFYKRIIRQIQQVAPFFHDFRLVPQETNKNLISLNWNQLGSDELFGPQQLSDGTLRMIGLIALLMQPEDNLPKLILLDEPELGLHPFAISLVAGMIRKASVDTQVIVATQSPLLVSEFEPEDVVVVERKASGQPLLPATSSFTRLAKADLEEWLKEYSLGELWLKNVISGRPVHE